MWFHLKSSKTLQQNLNLTDKLPQLEYAHDAWYNSEKFDTLPLHSKFRADINFYQPKYVLWDTVQSQEKLIYMMKCISVDISVFSHEPSLW